jgi:putative addiction module component (TIGR02574 family)
MSAIPEKLEDKAMKLPAYLRAQLAERLIASLDQDHVDADAEALWAAEARRRAEELDTGKVAGISAERALAKARAYGDRRRTRQEPSTFQ